VDDDRVITAGILRQNAQTTQNIICRAVATAMK
jgi:hypothetical protein